MMKKFLCGALAVAMTAAVIAPAQDASAASVPKAKYTFNMNKKSSKVVKVARKGENSSTFAVDTSKKGYEGGSLPKATKKNNLVYKKGKHGKALYLDRKTSYGAELKGIKLGKGSWTVSFWVKPDSNLGSYMSMFFTGSNITNVKKTKWISITKSGDGWLNGTATPTIWSHNAALDKADDDLHFPWYAFQNEEGTWQGDGDNAKATAVKGGTWSYVTLVVDTKDTCEYGTKGDKGYVKSYHAWTYINGALYGNGTVAKNSMSNSNKFFLGINAWDAPFKGLFDDVQLWNKALKAKQVKALYKKMK